MIIINTERYNKMKESKRIKSAEKFNEFVKSFNGEFEIMGEFQKRDINIEMKHNLPDGTSHIFIVQPGNFYKRCRCTECHKANKAYTMEEFKEEFYKIYDKNDFEIVDKKYISNKTPITIKCKQCGNERSCRPVDILHGNTHGKKVNHKCPICNNISTSNYEIELKEYIESIYDGNILYNDRSILKGMEIDIYLPDENIAFEFDGLYWHSDKFKDNKYHLNKSEKCLKNGIKLIHIFEDEWIYNNDIVKNKIKYLLHLSNNKKVYARNCYIEVLDYKYKKEFLNANHIQGNDSCSISLGLWLPKNDGDELVAVMTFCKPRISLGQKNNSKYDYELSRFATEKDYNVIGSFGKLFKYFKDNYTWNKIITYADKRWSVGDLYNKNNFKMIRHSKPNYWYIKNSQRFHRYNFRKQLLKDKFPNIYSDTKTEKTIMHEAGYYIIYDCGNIVYEYKK